MISEEYFYERVKNGILSIENVYPIKINTVEIGPKLSEDLKLTFGSSITVFLNENFTRSLSVEKTPLPDNLKESYFYLKMKPFSNCLWYFSEERGIDDFYDLGLKNILRELSTQNIEMINKPKKLSREASLILKILSRKE